MKKASSLFPTWYCKCASLPGCERSMMALQCFKSLLKQQVRNWVRKSTAAALHYPYFPFFFVIPSLKDLLCSWCAVSLEYIVSEWEYWTQFGLVCPPSDPLSFNGMCCTQVSIKLVVRKCTQKRCTCQPNVVILINATKSCRNTVLSQQLSVLKLVSFWI